MSEFWVVVLRGLRKLGGADRDIEEEQFGAMDRFVHAALGVLLLVLATFSAICAGLAWGSVFAAVVAGVGVFVLWDILAIPVQWVMGWSLVQALGHSWARLISTLVGVLALAVLVSWMNMIFISMITYQSEIKDRIDADFRKERSILENKMVANESALAAKLATRRADAIAAADRVRGQNSGEIGKLQAEVTKLRGDYQVALKEVNDEADGRARSAQRGCGTICKQKQDNAQRVQGLYDDAVKRLDATVRRLDPSVAADKEAINKDLQTDLLAITRAAGEEKLRLQHQIEELEGTSRYGFFNRHRAMEKLWWEDPLATWPFQALLLFFEVGYVLLTLLVASLSPYARHHRHQAAVDREKHDAKMAAVAKARRDRIAAEELAEAQHLAQKSNASRSHIQTQLAELEVQIEAWRAANYKESEIKRFRLQWLKERGLLKAVA